MDLADCFDEDSASGKGAIDGKADTGTPSSPSCSLRDIVHSEAKLYLVFEFLDMDLKKYMDTIGSEADGLGPALVKVGRSLRVLRVWPSL